MGAGEKEYLLIYLGYGGAATYKRDFFISTVRSYELSLRLSTSKVQTGGCEALYWGRTG